ncbi:MAG: ATP-binding protein [Terracidiphilus sp.]|jgi:energy-coupling factor transporter ATP-binding protein EcfA2
MNSPFEFGRELGLGTLVDREKELAMVEQTIREGAKLFLVGPRRFGKTSILRTAADRLKAESAIVLRLDAESFPTLDLLVVGIVAGAARHLKGGVKRAGEQARRFFQSLRPELDYSVSDNTWSAKLGSAAIQTDHTVLLTDALNGLEKLAQAQPAGRPVGLIIDEFQRVIELGGRAAEGQIRSAIQTHSRVGYVFAGSKTHMLNDMVTDAARPFYRLGSKVFLGPVPREDFSRFLREKFIESGFAVEDGAIGCLLDLAEDVPYNVQMLAHSCWTRLRDGGAGKPSLGEPFVRETLDGLVRQQDPFFAQLWTTLTPIQQRTLLAVVEQDGVNLQSTRTSQAVGRGPGTIRKSLHSMIDSGILREERSVSSTRLRFEDPFFAQWIHLVVMAANGL